MNDEEKKVLELLRMANELMGCILDDKQANIILNLIDKLQKENERYKKAIDNGEYTWKQKYEETFGYVKELIEEKERAISKLKKENQELKEENIKIGKASDKINEIIKNINKEEK